jgi:hypothetical protein
VEEEKRSILKITESVTDLIQKLAGPMVEEVGLMLGDKARVYRIKNWVETALKTERILRNAGLPPNAVPPRLLLPIIEGSSLENDDSLQELWAGLLASASQQNDAVSPSFVETLKQLTPAEARHLERIYTTLADVRGGRLAGECPVNPVAFTERGGDPVGVSSDAFERLGLVRRDYDVKLQDKPIDIGSPMYVNSILNDIQAEMRYQFILTRYALKFLEACHGPSTSSKESTRP